MMPEAEAWAVAEEVAAIRQLCEERNAVILAHNYMTPDIFHGVADITGDSLALARAAATTEADVIVSAGVHFMAETAAITCPDRTVLIPDPTAGCSLAESITAADVRALRHRHPGVPIVAYVNTSAAVKAEVDICCTSGNAVEVVRSLGAAEVIMLPDRHLAAWVAGQVPDIRIIPWHGACEVHDRFTGSQVRSLRADGVTVIAHPECPADVLAEADFVGSTAAMTRYVTVQRPRRVALITECSMADNVAADCPDVEFVRPCNLCPHMKKIALAGIHRSLATMTHQVTVPEGVAAAARRSIDAMLAVPAAAGVVGAR